MAAYAGKLNKPPLSIRVWPEVVVRRSVDAETGCESRAIELLSEGIESSDLSPICQSLTVKTTTVEPSAAIPSHQRHQSEEAQTLMQQRERDLRSYLEYQRRSPRWRIRSPEEGANGRGSVGGRGGGGAPVGDGGVSGKTRILPAADEESCLSASAGYRTPAGGYQSPEEGCRSPNNSTAKTFFYRKRGQMKQTQIPLNLNRWAMLLTAFLLMCLHGPLVMNWSEISQVMEENSIYLWMCDGKTEATTPTSTGNQDTVIEKSSSSSIDGGFVSCAAQRDMFLRVGTVAFTVFFFGGLAGGVVLDIHGPRATMLLGLLGFKVSYFILGLAKEHIHAYFIWAVLQAWSTEFCFYGVITVPNLFPRRRAFALCVIGAARSMCMLLPVVVHYSANKLKVKEISTLR